MTPSFERRVSKARRVLVLGIGGGGDVVGALAVARRCEALGTPFVLGGVAWERLPVDPCPGPRPVREINGGEPLGAYAVLAGDRTRPHPRACCSRSRTSLRISAAPTVLIDVTGGPWAAQPRDRGGGGRCSAATSSSTSTSAATRSPPASEPGLASPLCDAVMLAAGMRQARSRSTGCWRVLGAGCDGELSVDEVLARVAALAQAGAWLGTLERRPDGRRRARARGKLDGTEASMQVVRCARGELGRGRDPRRAAAACRWARSARSPSTSTSRPPAQSCRWRRPCARPRTSKRPARRWPTSGSRPSSTTSATERRAASRRVNRRIAVPAIKSRGV